jgi:hypothetical protein
MKRILTIYVILISFLVSQDAIQLFAQKCVKFLEKETVSTTYEFDNTAEDFEDSLEDENEVSYEEAEHFYQHFDLIYQSYQTQLNDAQKASTLRTIYLDKITPPPQA